MSTMATVNTIINNLSDRSGFDSAFDVDDDILDEIRREIADAIDALLRERESDVPEGMAATKLKPPLPKSFLGTEDFCFCDSLVSLQGISGDGSPEGYLGSVRLKVNGKFVTYVRERESAKAAVTDEMVAVAMNAWNTPSKHGGTYVHGPADLANMRAALEAVAPGLASARVPDGWQLVPVECTLEMQEALRAVRKEAARLGEPALITHIWEAMLAAAPKPEKEE